MDMDVRKGTEDLGATQIGFEEGSPLRSLRKKSPYTIARDICLKSKSASNSRDMAVI